MSASVSVTGVQPFAVDAFIPSGAEPGRFVVDAEPTTDFPQFTTITFFEAGTTLAFPNCRLVSSPKVTKRGARAVYEDERWKLRNIIMPTSFNVRSLGGSIVSATEKTYAQLWAEIAAVTGLTIAATSPFTAKPECDWAGRSAKHAVEQLLARTVSNFIYDAADSTWRAANRGTGSAPDVSSRLYRDVSTNKPGTVRVISPPNLYVAKVSCDAKLIGANGSLVDFGAGTAQLNELWTGFHSATATLRESFQASAFRVWVPTSTAHPESINASDLLFEPTRLLTLCPSASRIIAVGPQAISDNLRYGASVYRSSSNEGTSDVGATVVDGKYILTDRAILAPDSSGEPKTTMDFALAYAWKENGALKRTIWSDAVPGGGSETVDYQVDWIKYAYSNLANTPINIDDSDAEIEQFGEAVRTMYSQKTSNVRIPSIFDYSPSGQTGAVRLICSLYPARLAQTSIALNYQPSSGLAL